MEKQSDLISRGFNKEDAKYYISTNAIPIKLILENEDEK